MKRTFLSILVGLNVAAGLQTVRSQSEEKPVPKPPYLASVPDYGHWIVSFKYQASPSPAAAGGTEATSASSPSAVSSPASGPATTPAPAGPDGSPTSIETIKTGDLRGITLSFANQPAQQYTCQGDWVLRSTPNGPQLGIASPTAHPYIYYTTGFIFLDGVKIGPSTFKLAEKHNGVMSFHYHSGDTDIWINPDTMLPTGAKQEGVEASYQFLTPPPRPFPIPKDQESLLEKEKAAYQATSSMR